MREEREVEEKKDEGETRFLPCLICVLLVPTLSTPETGPEVGTVEVDSTALVGAAATAPAGTPP